jgi:hypothetical protein
MRSTHGLGAFGNPLENASRSQRGDTYRTPRVSTRQPRQNGTYALVVIDAQIAGSVRAPRSPPRVLACRSVALIRRDGMAQVSSRPSLQQSDQWTVSFGNTTPQPEARSSNVRVRGIADVHRHRRAVPQPRFRKDCNNSA